MNRARRFYTNYNPLGSPQENLNLGLDSLHEVSIELFKIKNIIMCKLKEGQPLNIDIIEYYNDLRHVKIGIASVVERLSELVEEERVE
ncbi:hypothetical protein [Listeria fleischmannii]|uniref:hypothetical protein n=1 Tax=Listeria fleischmannii TaxID=1069827 RepID=UPI000254F9B9|nr:hypothetical protein [Listeria fleischmannii]EIA21389.1 hypothetical protein KKC_01327 [Listeria fleischmannii subsp. coloradonensis]STY35287.1 Uncharacterised protein [Listeria fleischmannii subsp. coloradonensis]